MKDLNREENLLQRLDKGNKLIVLYFRDLKLVIRENRFSMKRISVEYGDS